MADAARKSNVAGEPAGMLRVERAGGDIALKFAGRWDIATVSQLDKPLRALSVPAGGSVRFELGAVTALDSSGAWAVYRLWKRLRDEGRAVEITSGKEAHRALIERLEKELEKKPEATGSARRRQNPVLHSLDELGANVLRAWSETKDLLSFFGMVIVGMIRSIFQPQRIRLTSTVNQIERVGLNALPIVGLLSFLIGVVLAYQGIDQLRAFGAEVFTVNLAGLSILREIGILMTAILVAGRSGSAFTAQIGTMRIREEIDAMRTLGLDPLDILVLPRIFALTFTMPLLAFYADIVGLFGAAVATMAILDMPPTQFLDQLRQNVPIRHFWVGISKAPVFGFIIALVGCRYGLKVKGSADAVGRRTTQAVVEGIFLVIVFDAIFSIIYSRLGI